MSNWVNSSGVSSNSGAAMMPTTPAISADRTQVINPSRSGSKPSSTAPFSDSDAARTARPVRVYRDSAQSAAASRAAMTASHIASFASRISSVSSITPLGSTLGRFTLAPSKRTPIMPCSTSRMPTLATTFASTGARRNARNTSR